MCTNMRYRILALLASLPLLCLLAILLNIAKTGDEGLSTTQDVGGDDAGEVEYVVPLKKWPPPLGEHDLLYGANQLEVGEEKREGTGHYRQKLALLWDPHPEYEFSAFGRPFHLVLAHGHTFALPNLKVTHVWENTTLEEEPGLRPDGCFYTGRVRGDPQSSVVVNLCHGMRGHIKTSDGSYSIEPAEPWSEGNTPIKHAVRRIPGTGRQCDTDTGGTEGESPGLAETVHEEVQHNTNQRNKRSLSQEYFIELMVVADKKMAEFHGTNIDAYIFTLMSTVTKIFKDASIGNPISIALVKLYILRDVDLSSRDKNGKISAPDMLRRFCLWQRAHNDPSDTSPNHHDSAVLLTRELLCRDPKSEQCDTLGLADVGRMCDQSSSCSLVKDNGLSAAFTIAHELGHVLNLPHDDDHRCQPYRGTVKNYNVMSRVLDQNADPWAWSNCSRHLLTEYLDAGYGNCLLDHPTKDILTHMDDNRLPGEDFHEDRQCELIYGKGSYVCPDKQVCGSLWCIIEKEGQKVCSTQHMLWAEGTPCRKGYWCQRGNCVPTNREALKPVNGGWGQWQHYGECSRTCGGGVKKALRYCNNPTPANGGHYCIGRRVKYKSCSTRECPSGSIDFRELQCAEYNNNNFNNKGVAEDVKWVPKYGGISSAERCQLFCRESKTTNYFRLNEKVIDGTTCGPDTFDICINGVCHPAGCDHILNSTTKLDSCGQCGGNNSTCRQIKGQYDLAQYGYTSVVRIPAGSSYLDIRQNGNPNSKNDSNYLALRDSESGDYILNGCFIVSPFGKSILYGGSKLEYSGSDAVVERINSSKLLTKDLLVEVLSVGNLYPPNITFEYTIHISSLVKYSWELSEKWGGCNKICQGEEQKEIRCIKKDGGEEISPEMCNGFMKPEIPIRACNVHCKIKWEITHKGECSSLCGGGIRVLHSHCVQTLITLPSKTVLVDNSSCSHLPHPPQTESCVGPCDEPRWNFTQWGQCSKSCGTGIQTREAFCVDKQNRPRNESDCRKSERIVKRVCNQEKCPYWMTGDWTPCSVSCGTGERQRPYWCKNVVTASESDCPQDQRPRDREKCVLNPCPQWVTHPWSQCSVTCGHGEQTRLVECNAMWECTIKTKPPTTKPCIMPPCSIRHENAIPDMNSIIHHRYVWRTRQWSLCSVTCGQGERRREVECIDEGSGKAVESSKCGGESPIYSETCIAPRCPYWAVGKWGPCSAIQGRGIEKRSVQCLGYDGEEEESRECPSPKPEDTRACNVASPHSQWITGKWSECSVSCGGGIKWRQVTCKIDHYCTGDKPLPTVTCNPQPCSEGVWKSSPWSQCSVTCGRGQIKRKVWCESKGGLGLSDEDCASLPRPHSSQPCHQPSCHHRPYHWQVSHWSPCSRSCGRGVKKREVFCASDGDEAVSAEFCRRQRRPKETAQCKAASCSHDWLEGQWTQCSASCGRGKQRRSVWCTEVKEGGKRHLANEELCDPQTRPELMRVCQGQSCTVDDYRWVTGPWQQCTLPCSKKGKQVRRLFCYKGSKKVRRKDCPKESRPEKRKKCPPEKCASCEVLQRIMGVTSDGEYILLVRGKPLSVYCHYMMTQNPVEYLTLPAGSSENYAEKYDKSLRNLSSCPEKGQRIEHCDCIKLTEKEVGFTSFDKIRINITTLIVERRDFTFASHVRGLGVSYGEAGDCYSKLHCPQGQFSIDLSGTGLRVHPSAKWSHSGRHVSHRIHPNIDNTRIVGKCGGYCGICRPEGELRLDVLPP